jgi:hypothetical protein
MLANHVISVNHHWVAIGASIAVLAAQGKPVIKSRTYEIRPLEKNKKNVKELRLGKRN